MTRLSIESGSKLSLALGETMLIKDTIFGVVDVEATGVDTSNDQVCECALIPACLARGVLPIAEGGWVDLFDPGIPIPAAASAVHHITDEDVRGCCHLNDVCLGDFAFEAFAAHFAEYDGALVQQINGRPIVCTYRLARKLWPELDQYGNQFLRYHFKLEIPEDIKRRPMHRAYPDAFVTACLLLFELKSLAECHPEIETVEALVEWIEAPFLLHRINFGKYGPFGKENAFPQGRLWSELPSEYFRWILDKGTDFDADTRYTAAYWLTEKQRRKAEPNESPDPS